MKLLGVLTLALLALVAGLLPARAADTTVLAAGGKALLPIVVAANASKETRAVADELAGYLQRITGAPFSVTTGDGKRGIVLGAIADFPVPALAKALEIRNGVDGREAYAIRSEKARLLLLGGADLGASHAAFRLLEVLGCRWFFPAKEWEIVPRTPKLAVSLDESSRPAVLSRRIWYMVFYEGQNRATQDALAWKRHNRMASSREINCGHAWQSIVLDNKAVFDAHPEYLALTGGKRQGYQLCVSNPGLQQVAAEWALTQFRRNPAMDMVSVEASDGGGQCECDECKKLGKISNRIFGLANVVARAVAKEFPGKMVGLYAYGEHCEPPDFALEPNVYVQSTVGFISGRYTFDELVQLWPKVTRNWGFYLYFSVYYWDWDTLPGGTGGNVPWMRREIPRLAAAGATSFDAESGNNWGPHGRGYYVANRLMWNPKVDVVALLKDFYAKAFGAGAAAMQRYYERLDPGNKPIMSENLLAAAFRDIDEAARLTAAQPDIQARLDQLKQYLHFVRLRWDLTHTPDKAKQKELTLAALTHLYRTRYAYMNSWEAIRQLWTPQAAKDFNEPAWSFADPAQPKAWAVETPYTHAEAEARFREDLQRFQLQDIKEVKFSEDLAPSGLRTAAPAASSQTYQNPGKYALYSAKGEPLEIALTAGVIAWYRDRAEAEYRLLDAAGTEIAKARLPLDGQPHPLSLAVPKAGLYWLVMNDQGTAWNISAAAGKPVAVVLSRDYHPIHSGWMQRMYFYVPKGTKEIQYFWNGGPHVIYGPDGAQRARVTASGKWITGPVRPGEDGKAWSFGEFALGELYFANIPGCLAASPDALLLPRELVKKDGIGLKE